ncbi:MlaD family protein [Haliangium sp.]|uniref:MlaD family protein n=1 Tax=Haliangium sp. TaxID=2663208 RepID=UPI003D1066F2
MALAVHDQRLTTRVGAGALVAVAGLVLTMLVLARCEVRERLSAVIYFEHVGPLREGAEVQVAGRVIGAVSAITLVPSRQARAPGHPLAGRDGVGVFVRIERRRAFMAPVNGEYFISAKGIIGERFIEVGPPVDGSAYGRPIAHGDELRGVDAPHLDRALWRAYDSLMLSRRFLSEIGPEARALMRSLEALEATLDDMEAVARGRALWAALGELADEAQPAVDGWRESELTWADLAALRSRTEAMLARTQAATRDLRARAVAIEDTLSRIGAQIPDDLGERLGSTFDTIERALAKSERILASVNQLVAMIERGQGTAGALLNDPEFFDDVKALNKVLERNPWRVVGPPPAE